MLETLRYLKRETSVWFEVTNLLIPGHNDSEQEVDRLAAWFAEDLGPDVPLHFTAFHPDYRMREVPPTPPRTCLRARRQALAHGLRYVYTGNIHGAEGQSTKCPSCGTLLVERDWHKLGEYALEHGRCGRCGTAIAGRFADRPGAWGRRRLQLAIG